MMAIRLKFIALLALWLVFGVVATVGANDINGVDRAIARAWLSRAKQLVANGLTNGDNALETALALRTAEDFTPASSDISFFKALLIKNGFDDLVLIGGESEPQRVAAFGFAEKAVSSASADDVVEYERKAVLLASLGLGLERYEEVLDLFDSMAPGHKLNPTLIYAAARSALFLGLFERTAELALIGESLSEAQNGVSELNEYFSGPSLPIFRALAVAAGDNESLSTLHDAGRWGTALGDALHPWILSGHIEAASIKPYHTVLNGTSLAALDLLSTDSAEWDFSGDKENPPQELLTDLAFLRRLGPLGVNLLDRYSDSYTGTMTADSNYDGIPEETVKFLNGNTVLRTIDSNQDGDFEWDISFDGGVPIQVRTDGGRTTVIYDGVSYPKVLRMMHKEGDANYTVGYKPGAFSWSILSGHAVIDSPTKPLNDDETMWKAAGRVIIEALSMDGLYKVKSTTMLSRGEPIAAKEEGLLVKAPDAGVIWMREIAYSGGIPIAGRRSLRMDDYGDPVWDVYERYEDGEIVGLAWDPEASGNPVYIKDWALDPWLEIAVWDINGDSWPDVRRLVLPDRVDDKALFITEVSEKDLLPWSADTWSPWEY